MLVAADLFTIPLGDKGFVDGPVLDSAVPALVLEVLGKAGVIITVAGTEIIQAQVRQTTSEQVKRRMLKVALGNFISLFILR